jgi:hypothetical protein
MRRVLDAALVLPALVALFGGCAPDIATGVYICGDEQLCPTGKTCNGADNTCVNIGTAEPFACLATELHEPDDTIAQAFPLPALGCVSTAFIDHGCLNVDDNANWYAFSVPDNCSAVEVDARIDFLSSSEILGLQLWTDSGASSAMIGADTMCAAGVTAPGTDARCIKMTLAPGDSYGIVVAPTGDANCSGTCRFNRYQLTLQLATPG